MPSSVWGLGLFVVALAAHLHSSNRGNRGLSRCVSPEMIPHIRDLDALLSRGVNVSTGTFLQSARVAKLLHNSSVSHVPVLDDAVDDHDLARRLLIANVPFVLRNARDAKRVRRLLSQAYFEKKVSDTNVTTIDIGDDNRIRYDIDHRRPSTLKREYENMRGSNASRRYISLYARDLRLADALAHDELSEFFTQFSPLIDGDDMRNFTIRMGFDDLEYGTHFDFSPNFLCQLAGTKRVFLFNYGEEARMYWNAQMAHPRFRQSEVWPREMMHEHGDFHRRYPEFGKARGLQAFLKEGETLYIPPFWFHYLETATRKSTQASGESPHWLSVNAFAKQEAVNNQITYPCPSGTMEEALSTSLSGMES